MKKCKPKLLDLFCCAGGGAYGYARAGFDITGVDIKDQPNYPYKFIKTDAVEYLRDHGHEYDVIHASPPCQKHTKAQQLAKARNGGVYPEHPDFIQPIRELLVELGKPYIIENVQGAPLIDPLPLYGSQFNLKTQRCRLFESNLQLSPPEKQNQKMKTPAAGNGLGDDGSISICGSGGVRGLNAKQIKLYWGFALGGIDWMSRQEMAECIPPAYTEFIGKQAINIVRQSAQ